MSIYSQAVDKIAKKYLKKRRDRIFDCGCGDGFHTFILKKYSDCVVGGDFENRTNRKYNINFRKIKPYKYGQGSEFDVVTSFDVIEHVSDEEAFLNELVQITKENGLIIIGTPGRNRLGNLIKMLLGKKITYPHKLGYHYESGGDIIHLREYTMDELTNLAKKNGNLAILEKRPVFLGVYTNFGPLGLKDLKIRFLSKYCNHLFIILKKIETNAHNS